MIEDLNIKIKKKTPIERYKKSPSLLDLEKLHFAAKKIKHSSIEEKYLVHTLFTDRGANELTKSIIAYLQLKGHAAFRVNSTGIYDKRINAYRPSGARRGLSDINAVINGKSVSIEIKTGRDKMSPYQMKFRTEVEAAGGIYIVVRNFDDFLKQINEI